MSVNTPVYGHHLVDVFEPLDRRIGERLLLRAVETACQYGAEGGVYERRFARSAHSGHDGEGAERQGEIHVAKVVARRSEQSQGFAVAFASLGRELNASLSIEVGCREGIGAQHFGRGAAEHYLSALASGFGADVDHVVGFEHHLLVVLHHDDRIVCVAQFLERVDQPAVVALMQAYARLVEDIEHVD